MKTKSLIPLRTWSSRSMSCIITYHQTCDISGTLVGNKLLIAQMKSELCLLALLQLHLHSWLKTWLQWIGQRQLQVEMKNMLIFWIWWAMCWRFDGISSALRFPTNHGFQYRPMNVAVIATTNVLTPWQLAFVVVYFTNREQLILGQNEYVYTNQ